LRELRERRGGPRKRIDCARSEKRYEEVGEGGLGGGAEVAYRDKNELQGQAKKKNR